MQATGMDLPSKTMYDTFKGDIWKELGPLDPDWFEALTAQAFANDGNVSDQEDLCANQEGRFKTPFDKTAVDSQLFSTPKVFRHSRIVSPETEDEKSFTAEQEKERLPWMTTQSPCLFQMSKQGVEGVKYGGIHPQSQDSFDLLNTPDKSSVSYAKNISESLCAQINPDISWTSSFNTPPAIPSTLILSKHDESPCPVSLPEDKNVVLVRKLFPSLSNSSRLVSPKNSDLPSGHQGVVSPEPGQNPESHNCPQTSLNQSDGVWKQMLPDAIEDGEMRSTIASVLDGAEDVLSIFFTNSSSALRRVKTERIRRKQIQTKQHGCISTDISTTNNTASSEQRPADQDPGRLPSPPPVKPGDIGITQWSPLSLSEIPPCTVDTSCPDDGAATQVENNVSTEQLWSDFESGQLVRPPTKITDSGFTKKKRKFVYTVQSSKLQVQREDRPSQRMDSSPGIPDSGQKVNVKQLVKAPDETDCIRKNEMSEQGNLVEESLPHSVQAKAQDLDISQLSKDFAQDFSQMTEPGNLSKVAVQNVFSPSACLSAMKQTNQRERQAKLHHDCDGIRNRGSVFTPHQNNSICEGAVSDSGFQSGVGDISHVTASSFVPPSSENNGQHSGFKTDIYRTTPFPSTNKESGKAHLDDILQEAGTDAKLCSTIKESRTLGPSEMCMESTSTQLHSSAKGTVDTVNCTPFNGQAHGSLPEKTTVSLPSAHASGFKTASNKGIQISSANLERAKRLFEETEGEQTLSNQPIKCVRSVSHGSLKNTTSNSLQPCSSSVTFVDNSCQLTASQKADVTELCTLLEEADSQFEFTQFRTAKPRQHCPDNATSPPKTDKELDPDFLTGIDFDDSFNSDAEKQPTCDQMTSVSDDKTKNKTSVTSKSTGFSLPCAIKKEDFSTEDVSSSVKHFSEGSSGIVSSGSKSLDRSGHTEASKLDNKNTLMLGVGFKTAGGNVLRVSKTCLNKARALFADLEENPVTCEKPQEKQSSKTDTKTWHKRSADNSNGNSSTLVRHKEDRRPAVQHTEVVQHNVEIHNFVLKNTPASTKAASPHGTPSSTAKAPSSLPCTATSKNIGSISINELSNAGGFCTASGEKVIVSADAMKKAECLLNDIHTLEGANKELKQKGGALKTGHIINQIQVSTPKSGGFQTASGKGVTISSEALKKAKSLLSECDEVEDKICAKPTHSKTPVPGPPPRNSGFLAASGKPVAFSSEALRKAKALFSDISLNAEIPAISDTRNSDKKQDNVNDIEKIHCGFSTARGAKVHVSQKNLLKAANLLKEFDDGSISAKATQEADAFFKDCDNQGSKDGMSINHWKSIAPVSGNGSEKKSLPKFKQDHKVTNVSEESGSRHTKLEKMSMERIVNYEKMLDSDNMKIHKVVLNNTPDPDCSSGNKLSSSGGFCTASGKKVSVSDEAMIKAKSLLNENATLEDKQLKQKDTLLPQNAGFQTASGKGVAISSAALKKAKTLLSECEGVEDQIAAKPTHSKMPVPGPPPRNHGFLAASGKSVAFSTEALKKAKALFSDMDFSADVPAVSHKTKSEHKDAQNDTEKIHCGFSTAREAKVHVSQKNLLKAKNLLKEFDDGSISAKATQEADASFKDCDHQDGKDGMSMNHWKSIASVSDNGSEKKSLPKFKQDHKVTNISEESGSGHTKLEKMSMEQIVNYEKMLDSDNMKIHKVVLNNTPDPDCSSGNKLSSSGGFCTASGKKVSVSDEAMIKAKSLLNENATLEDKQLKQKDTLLPQNAGFQTASGKGVAISSAALKKAKTLLSECEGVEDQIAAKPTDSKMPVPGPPPRNHGFLAASGKSVAFSTEALQKAKALFSDMDFSANVPAVSHKTKSEHKDAQNDTDKIHCGFSTAGGAKVHVAQKNLLKAKNLFNDLTGVECHDSNSTSPADTHKLDILKVKDVKRASNSNLTTASERDIPANESAPQMVTSLQATDHENDTLQSSSVHDCIFMKDKAPTDAFKIEEGRITSSGVGSLHDNPREEMSTVLNYKINQTSSSGGSKVNRTEESSVLCFESFNLSGCTETQQRLLAQEALDCTKALLEDENLAGQRLSMTLENVPQQDNSKSMSVKDQRGRGKRHVEDPDITGQPPLKRRLLEEFDRTVEGPRGSTLHPEKSIPDGVMKDRRVFKYGVSLHANITRPHRNGNSYVETRIQKTPSQHSITGDSRSAYSKMPMFVPPFLKNTESRKNTVIKDSIRTPSAFVPPFKKQRTIVKESSSTPQEEKLQHTVTPFNSNTYVPPTKTTQSTSDVTGTKSKEDIQMVALVDTTNDNLVNNEKIPVGCGSEGSSAEALCVEDTLFRSQDMFQDVHNIELARDMQHMRIRKKKRQTIRPLPGSLFLTKSSGVQRIPLKAAVNGKPPARFSQKQLYSLGVHQHACEVTSETAESFRFTLRHFVKQEAFIDGGGVQLADGGWLIPSNDGTAGKEEFYRALCDTPGVDPKLISEEWVYNHYRWIVWKQASMERSFPETMGSLCLTPEQVLLQLKYRYDVEVDHSRRPALRKIMEKDDTAAKTLVLCVCGVVSRGHSPKRHSCSDVKTPGADAKVENPSAVVWLTDGWYAIKAQLDEPLTAMLHKGRLAVGGKLIIHGAQLVGSQDACSPLEAPDSLMLKICANSSRPTRWHAKLGFHKDPRPFLLPISSLYSNGGPVGCVDIIILRSYPIQWMERKPDGGVVFRSVRAEEKEARRYNNHKQKAMEVLFAKIQAEFEKEEKGNNKPQRRRRTISRQDIASLQDGEELYEAVGDDAAYLEAHLSEQQLEALHTYRRSQMDKKQAELQDRYRRALENAEDQEGSCPKRDVTPVWRVCIADSMDQPGSVYQLNLWRPPSDLQSLLKEGCRYKVYNLTTSDGKKHGGSTTVQLTGTKKTQFQDLQASQDWLSTHFQPRVSTHFVDLQNPEFQSLCGEVDLTGYVISIIDGQGFSPAFYLADGKLNFVKVRCFSSFAQSGLEDVVKPRVLLALSNLQLRGQSTSPTPVVYAGDLTVFSTNPKEVHLQESLSQLRNLVQGQENFFLTAEKKLSHLVKSDSLSSISSPALQARTPATDKKDTKSVMSQQPVRGFGCFTPVTRNPPATNCSTEKDPIRLKRRRALDYLSRIPSPPPLSNLGSVASPCVNKTFNPPRRSGTPSTLKTVQTPACKPVNSPLEDEWVNDEELAMIDTQALLAHD